jgi:hypothetical protein
MFPLIAAGIGAGASLLGGYLNNKAQAKAQQQQLAFLQQGVNQLGGQRDWMLADREDALGRWQPLVNSGNQARGLLSGFLGLNGAEEQAGLLNNFQNDPGISFLTDQGRRSIEASRASRGLLHAGGTVRQLGELGMAAANDVYNKRIAGLTQMAQSGQAALQGQTATRLGYLDNITKLNTGIAGIYGGMGNASAAGTIGQANAWSGALQGAGNALGYGMGAGGSGYLQGLYNRYFADPTMGGWDATVAAA